jgi:hypothetical protein
MSLGTSGITATVYYTNQKTTLQESKHSTLNYKSDDRRTQAHKNYQNIGFTTIQRQHGFIEYSKHTKARHKANTRGMGASTGVDDELTTQSSINFKIQHITAYTFGRSGDSRWDPKISAPKEQQATKKRLQRSS